uniref:NADH-ubiquinone oxidoreductase chain 4L n=1 Tax=Zygeupolia rubens TaxID=166045 RepID=I1SR58_9BILA|nr:NADH dehydrogenase subunit 4L [Zygeupolia rubens]ADZ05378.1 NADH dehydrogenase subunit 4L [Zygeupolia rubens]
MFVGLDFGFSFLGIMLMFGGYVSLFMERGHLLMVLLLLESVILELFFVLLFGLALSVSSLYLSLVLISFGACEASVGLSLLVSLIRSHGNDFVSLLTVYEC